MPAARLTDMHVCPAFNGPVPHVGGPIAGPCAPNVLTGMLPQARVTDMCICVGPPDVIVRGSPTVLVNGLPAARIGDTTAHGGVIIVGLPTVLIGETGGGGGGGGAIASSSQPAAKAEEQRLKLDGKASVERKPYDTEAERSRSISASYTLMDGKANERQVWRVGDEDTYGRVLSADAEAKAVASFDIDKKEFAASAEVSGGVALAKGEAGGKALSGLVSGKVSGEVGSVSGSAKVGASASKEGAKAGAEVGAEAVVAKVKAEGGVRLTPKTLYDNSIGRLTDTKLPESWDKGISVGAEGEAGFGVAGKAKAEVAATAKEISLTLEAKAGLGPMAGLAAKIGIVW